MGTESQYKIIEKVDDSSYRLVKVDEGLRWVYLEIQSPDGMETYSLRVGARGKVKFIKCTGEGVNTRRRQRIFCKCAGADMFGKTKPIQLDF